MTLYLSYLPLTNRAQDPHGWQARPLTHASFHRRLRLECLAVIVWRANGNQDIEVTNCSPRRKASDKIASAKRVMMMMMMMMMMMKFQRPTLPPVITPQKVLIPDDHSP